MGHRQAHSALVRRSAVSAARLVVSGAASPREPGLDHRRVEEQRTRPRRESLRAHQGWPAAADARARVVEPALNSGRTPDRARVMSRRLLRIARQRWRALFRRDAVDDELARELAFHVEQLTQEFVEGGMSEREAQLAARRAVGNIPLLEEQSRDTRAVGWLHDLHQDVI